MESRLSLSKTKICTQNHFTNLLKEMIIARIIFMIAMENVLKTNLY